MPDISLDRFSGFADGYQNVRPQPPAKLCGILLAWAKAIQLGTVLDLGCGTGLSTRIWLPFAQQVIGIEPNAEMRAVADRQSRDIQYRDGSSYATGQTAASCDIVTCSQSFHWMEPTETIHEVSRILKPGGLFAVYDNQWPPAISWRSEQAYTQLQDSVRSLSKQYAEHLPREQQWPKSGHQGSLLASNQFEFVRTVGFDNQEPCDAQRFIDLAMAQGALQTLLKHQIAEIQPLIADFKETVIADIRQAATMTVSYSLVIGVKKP